METMVAGIPILLAEILFRLAKKTSQEVAISYDRYDSFCTCTYAKKRATLNISVVYEDMVEIVQDVQVYELMTKVCQTAN